MEDSVTNWLYAVNPDGDSYGYTYKDGRTVPPVEVMAYTKPQTWYLPRRLKLFAEGDRIWVRQNKPVGAVIGVGVVTSDLKEGDGTAFYFTVRFGSALCRYLAEHPVEIEVGNSLQQPRTLLESEAESLYATVFDFAVDALA